jgi:hypothetical protein
MRKILVVSLVFSVTFASTTFGCFWNRDTKKCNTARAELCTTSKHLNDLFRRVRETKNCVVTNTNVSISVSQSQQTDGLEKELSNESGKFLTQLSKTVKACENVKNSVHFSVTEFDRFGLL